MKRQLLHNWQFLLASQIKRSGWLIDMSQAGFEQKLLERFLAGEPITNFSSLPEELSLTAYSQSGELVDANESDQAGCCAVVNIVGTMFRYGTMSHYGADEYAAMLHEAMLSDRVSSVVLNIDSGGGYSGAVAPLLEAIGNLQSAGKPVVASVDTCGSAAYWVASACDKIFANNNFNSMIGSIGVYISFADYSEALKKDGIVEHNVYAPQSTDKNKYFHDALAGDYTALQNELLSPIAQSFIDSVKANRANVSSETFTGKMYYAPKAQELGLIDGVKTLSEAVQYAQNLAAVKQFLKQ